MYIYIILVILALLGAWAVGSYFVIKNIEQPAYTVLETRTGYEIREYAPYIVAQTTVTGRYSKALGDGFSLVADYIFGNNTTKAKIAMTTPVLESSSEKIAMTSPVLTTENDQTRTIAFILPSKYTLETLPIPNNPKVTLAKMPARTVAVLRFTWYASEGRVETKKAELQALLERDGLSAKGPVEVAQYNPPLSMPLTLRNEIIIPIEYIKQE